MSNKADRLTGCHEHLQTIYRVYPLARLLVESAGRVLRTKGYNRDGAHYAYNDWLTAVFGRETREMREVLWVVDQLLPANHPQESTYEFNPILPGLPPRPAHQVSGREKRRLAMLATLETIAGARV